jgi:hypothetical protein
MKNAALTVLVLGALSTAAVAQPELVWTTNRGSSTVTVHNNANLSAALATIPIDGSPYGIVGDNGRNRVYVAFSQTGTRQARLAVIHSQTWQLVNEVPIPGVDEARRLCQSRDKNFLFLACRHNGNGAVVALDVGASTDNPPFSLASEIVGSTGPAEDVTEVPSQVVSGGSGPAPGKLYYTVPFGAGAVGIHNFVTGMTSSVPVAPLNAALPWGLDRSPDDTFVLVGVDETTTSQYKLLQFNSFDDTQTLRTSGITSISRTWDVAFRVGGGGPPFTVYVLATSPSGAGSSQIFNASSSLAVFNLGGALGTVALSRSVVHLRGPTMDRLFMGDNNDLGNQFDVSPEPPPGTPWTSVAVGTPTDQGPTDFAFMPPPPRPAPAFTCPKGGLNQALTEFTVIGKDFMPGAVVQLQGISVPVPLTTTFIDSTLLRARLTAAGDFDENTVIVQNPDGQQGQLTSFWAGLNSATTATFSQPLPSLFQGYRMVSFPAYYRKSDLRQAFGAQFGPYNRALYRVFFWGGNRYFEIDEPDDEACDLAGGAFWVLTRFGGTLDLDALDARSNHGSADMRVLPLRPGWNMISLPFQNGALVNKDWAALNVTPDPDTWAPSALTGAAPLSQLFEFVNGQYVATTTLVAGRGYFVKNMDPTPQMLYLLIDTTVTKPSAAAGAVSYAAVPAGAETPPPPPGGLGTEEESSGCGLAGPELLLVFLLRRRRRKLGA